MMKNNLNWYEGREVTEQERKAIDEVMKLVNYSWTDEGIQDAIDDDSLSLNTCNNGRDAVWYKDESAEACVYVDTLKQLEDWEIDVQLTGDQLQEAAAEFYFDYIKKLENPMGTSFSAGWKKLCSIFGKHNIERSLGDFEVKEDCESGLKDFDLALREGTDYDVYVSYTLPLSNDMYDSAQELYEGNCDLGYWSVVYEGEQHMVGVF